MYEHQTYVEARRRFPREGRTIRTLAGTEKILAVDIWSERITLRDKEGARRSLSLEDLRKEGEEVGSGDPENRDDKTR
jgi:cell fate regulator YaaT (PSP1 superfamily)